MQATQSVDAYSQLTEIEHVLKRPDMYINSLVRGPRIGKCLNPAEMKIVQKQINLSEGQEQVFVEIIGNAADNVWESREQNVDPGVIEVMVNEQWFIVKNYGLAIPVAQYQNGDWIPRSIFGNLRSSSKYNDNKKRYLIGKNGLGGKLVNVYSRAFSIECADSQRGLLYKQTWQNNMSVYNQPEITQYQGPGYTQVSVSLDFARFGVSGFDQEALEIYAGHCAAISYTCEVPVIFNGQRFEIKDLVGYANLFYTVNRNSAICYKDPNGSYDLCIIDTPDTGEQGKVGAVCASFVNGIVTSNGGAHVDAAYKVVVKAIVDFLGKNAEGIRFTKADVANHISLFISCRIDKPEFTSQIKDSLKKPTPNIELPENLLKGIKKWQLIQIIYSEIQRKQMNKMKKNDGKRKKRPRTDKSQPANLAGGPRSMEATLILTEGDSADSYRLKFISQVPNGMGREYFGSLPLHGKLLNVLNAEFLQIVEHKDLEAIRHNLGLKTDVDYNDDSVYRKLNYGNLLIMPDPDNDGKHILGLVLLFFLHFYPGLVQRGFVKFLRIPVVRITINGQPYTFYSMTSFKRFITQLPPNSQIGEVDYFKGLGSSEDHHIKQDFMNPKVVTFKVDEATSQKILLAFHKTAANLRKQWIADWVNREVIDTDNIIDLPISTFIDHEFIDYSIESIIRSAPEGMDGLKESQRKALYAALRKLNGKKKKVKVAQVASHAAEITCYKHGEGCLADTIVQMTYDFIGSNNMAYFFPKGQFGCVDPETPILLWNGWIKLAKYITTDDVLVGDDGQPRHISKVVSGVDDMYTVNQSYGFPYKVNSQHILTLQFPDHRKVYKQDENELFYTSYYDKDEKKIKSIVNEDVNKVYNFIENISSINIFDINIQTYLSFPKEHRDLFRNVYNKTDIKWCKQDTPMDPYKYGCQIRNGKIDDVYIVNDLITRLYVLAGIIDTYNRKSPTKYYVGYSDSVKFLAQSLGFKTEKIDNTLCITINTFFKGEEIDITYAGEGPYVGWYLDGNERFLLGDFTVTHNTRNQGGKDAANPRYTCIALPWWTSLMYRKEDKKLEVRIIDDGEKQECENFFPILPMHVINGVIGIGTAYSTNIPNHNPLDVAFWLQQRLLQDLQPESNHQLPLIRPWYKGFKGQILLTGNGFTTEGIMRINNDQSIVIEELPIGTWTKDYEDDLAKWEEEGIISGFDTFCTDEAVKFVIYKYLDGSATPKKLKLISKHSYNNMTILYRTADRGIQPRIYNDLNQLLQDFYTIRLAKYVERKILTLLEIQKDILDLTERARFIRAVAVDKVLEIRDRPEADIHSDMTQMNMKHELLDKVKTRELNKDRIPVLDRQIQAKVEEKARLESIPPQYTWYTEIEEFVVRYCKEEKCTRSTMESCNPVFTLIL
jgi:DNA gyrase/topoisomerase IV subunit B